MGSVPYFQTPVRVSFLKNAFLNIHSFAHKCSDHHAFVVKSKFLSIQCHGLVLSIFSTSSLLFPTLTPSSSRAELVVLPEGHFLLLFRAIPLLLQKEAPLPSLSPSILLLLVFQLSTEVIFSLKLLVTALFSCHPGISIPPLSPISPPHPLNTLP